MSKKTVFHDDGSIETVHLAGSLELPLPEKPKRETEEQRHKEKERKKRKMLSKVVAEKEYHALKYGLGTPSELEPQPSESRLAPESAPESAQEPAKDDQDKDSGLAETKESKARQEALAYLDLFVQDKAKWKFQKVRQVWILQNMYFAHQMDNDGFKHCLVYLKVGSSGLSQGMGERQKKDTVREAKELLEQANATDTIKKRAKKIIKTL